MARANTVRRTFLRHLPPACLAVLAADLRRHPAGELPPFVPQSLEIGVAVVCHAECVVTRKGDGVWQRAQVEPGIVWLCPGPLGKTSCRSAGPP